VPDEAVGRSLEWPHCSLDPDGVERLVEVRLARQEILTRDDRPRLWAVIDEAVIRRVVGGTEVMRG